MPHPTGPEPLVRRPRLGAAAADRRRRDRVHPAGRRRGVDLPPHPPEHRRTGLRHVPAQFAAPPGGHRAGCRRHRRREPRALRPVALAALSDRAAARAGARPRRGGRRPRRRLCRTRPHLPAADRARDRARSRSRRQARRTGRPRRRQRPAPGRGPRKGPLRPRLRLRLRPRPRQDAWGVPAAPARARSGAVRGERYIPSVRRRSSATCRSSRAPPAPRGSSTWPPTRTVPCAACRC